MHRGKRPKPRLTRKLHANETVSVERVQPVRELAATVSLDNVIGAALVDAQVGVQDGWLGHDLATPPLVQPQLRCTALGRDQAGIVASSVERRGARHGGLIEVCEVACDSVKMRSMQLHASSPEFMRVYQHP